MSSNVSQQIFSGALSGLSSTVLLQPFDLLKTRLQQGDGSVKPKNSALLTQTVQNIIKKDGMRGLWRGTAPSLIRNVPGVAMYMTSLTQLRVAMARSPAFAPMHKHAANPSSHSSSVLPSLTSQGNLVAGATTRVLVGFALNPFSVLKARYESSRYAYSSLQEALGSVLRGGPSELFRGFVASSMRDAPYAGLFVVFYEGIKRETATLLPSTSGAHSAAIHSFSAATAGAVATVITHPFDVIKTKVQVRSEDKYHGLFRTVMTIQKQRGLAGFLDGVTLRMTRKVFSSAVGWAVYEGILLFIRAKGT